MARTLTIVTTHGTFELDIREDERVLDTLSRNEIPWTAVALYHRDRLSGQFTLHPSLADTAADIPASVELFAFFQRNIDPLMHARQTIRVSPPGGGAEAVAEYLYRDMAAGKDDTLLLKQLSVEECRQAVHRSVHETLREHLGPDEGIVVGVSGGGDSNALLDALSSFSDYPIRIHPVIVQGPGEWNSGVPRARELCAQYGLELTVVSEEEAKRAIGATEGGLSITDRFAKVFPDDDFEFVGTLIIRRVLMRVAKEKGEKVISTGLNLEDLLGEVFALMGGQKPLLPLPARQIGEVKLLYPLWLVPKKIIDGCFPKYSFANYEDRYPSYAEGRTLYYNMAYWFTSMFPQMPERFLRWAARQGSEHPAEFPFDERLGFETLEPVNWALRERFIRMLRTVA